MLWIIVIIGLAIPGWIIWDAVRYRRHPVRLDGHDLSSPEALDAHVDALMARMSLREKLDQLSGDVGLVRFLFRYGLNLFTGRGAPLVYSGRNRRLGIPPFGFADGPRGVNVGRGRTAFPVTMARGASFDVDLERRIGEAMAREIRAIGANYSGAVCINLLRHPGWGRAQETYGEDPHHLGAMGVALTQGLQRHNVMACVKHFALNSIENSRFYVDVHTDERTLREVYLPHFAQVIQKADVASVMSAYNRFRGAHCGHDRTLLTDILRGELGFEGFVTSDWLHGVRGGLAGLRAGMDVEMPARFRYGRALHRAVRRGRIAMSRVDESVRRVLRTRLRYATRPDPETYGPSLVACDDHAALAREAAVGSAVLIQNDGLLPLTVKPGLRIALIGPRGTTHNTGDRGSSNVLAPYTTSPEKGLRAWLADHQAVLLVDDGSDPMRAAQVATEADVALVAVGFTHHDEGEYFVLNPNARGRSGLSVLGGGGDRADLRLPDAQTALIDAVAAANPKTAVIYVGGSAVTLEWRHRVSAVLFTFYGGMEGGHGLARLLFGAETPSGKLPFTIPEDQSRLPPFDPFAERADYGPLHGYTLADTEGFAVAAAFGHGLSYTRFLLRDLEVVTPVVRPEGTLTVRVTVHNVGDRAGAEVVQLYIGFPHARVSRPPKLLRGFIKTHLAPDQAHTLDFAVPAADLAHWDPAHRRWVVEEMTYTFMVGTSSVDPDALTGTFVVQAAALPGSTADEDGLDQPADAEADGGQ